MRTFHSPLLLFPATYLVHILEEYFAGEGFYIWIRRVANVYLTPRQFLYANSALWIAMTAAASVASSPSWFSVALGFLVLVNGLGHLAGTIVTRAYSPGVVSGVTLWVPLGTYFALQGRAALPVGEFWIGIGTGLAIQAAVLTWAVALSRRNRAVQGSKIVT